MARYPKVLDQRTRRIDGGTVVEEVLIDFGTGHTPVWYWCRGSANARHGCARRDKLDIPPLTLDSCFCSGEVLKTDYGKERELVRDVQTNADETYLTDALYKEIAGGGEYKSIADRIADMR